MTEEPNDLPPDAYHDAAWPQILPWLARHAPETTPELAVAAPSPDWWLTESPAVTTMAVDHDDLCRRLARLFITRHPDVTFDDAFPTLPVRLPLAALRTGARARTAFQRLQLHTVGDVVKLCVHDLYAVRGTGQGTIEDITTALVSAAITLPAALGATAYDNELDTTTLHPPTPFPPPTPSCSRTSNSSPHGATSATTPNCHCSTSSSRTAHPNRSRTSSRGSTH